MNDDENEIEIFDVDGDDSPVSIDKNYDYTYVLSTSAWITNISLDAAIKPLRRVTETNNIFIADADVSTCVLEFRYGWEKIHGMFGTDLWIPHYAGTVMIPTFTGNHSGGHWHLTILSTLPDDTDAYVIDSLGRCDERIASSRKIVDLLVPDTDRIIYVPSPRQDNVECGARTFFHMVEIAHNFSIEDTDFKTFAARFNSMNNDSGATDIYSWELLHQHILLGDGLYPRTYFFRTKQSRR